MYSAPSPCRPRAAGLQIVEQKLDTLADQHPLELREASGSRVAFTSAAWLWLPLLSCSHGSFISDYPGRRLIHR